MPHIRLNAFHAYRSSTPKLEIEHRSLPVDNDK